MNTRTKIVLALIAIALLFGFIAAQPNVQPITANNGEQTTLYLPNVQQSRCMGDSCISDPICPPPHDREFVPCDEIELEVEVIE